MSRQEGGSEAGGGVVGFETQQGWTRPPTEEVVCKGE